MTGRSAGVIVQPGARPDDRVYCPVSGVVFQVRESSARRDEAGKPIYFCCEPCARYFSDHRERVLAARHLLPSIP